MGALIDSVPWKTRGSRRWISTRSPLRRESTDERVREDGDGPLAGGPADQLRADPGEREGDVLSGSGGAGPDADGEPVDLPGRGRPAGGEHAAEGGAAEHGLAPGPGEGVGGDDPAAGGPGRILSEIGRAHV